MSVYAANRLASITEDSQFCEEIVEAFADTTRESANLTSFGVIAQLHENDMRMFDAIIGADFASVSNGKLLEGAELVAFNEKMEKVTGSAIWKKIDEAIQAIKGAILTIARKIRDKVSDLVNVDKKLIDRYGKAIEDAKEINVKVKFGLPTKLLDNENDKSVTKAAEKCFGKIVNGATTIKDNLSDAAKVEEAKKKMDAATEELIKSVDNLFISIDGGTTITASDARAALDELKNGKKSIKTIKKIADAALKTVKEMEKAAKAAKSKNEADPAAAANVYKIVSGTGASVHKAMGIFNSALVKTLSAYRKEVLAAGRAALGAKNESFVMDNLFMCSDQFVAEVCEMI